ncbi:MAG TPA: EF-hand domain-containing protein [Steroidobacteraceae bacterium]|jgi:Ca2+-binding EF-hand superfamily protein
MKTFTALTCLVLACTAGGTLFAQGERSELKPIAFSTLDTNKDGKISLVEARADPGLYMVFDMLDTNHDGYLSRQEFQAWPRAMKPKHASDPTTAPSGSAGAQHMPTPSN